jgi:hypothetical protein
MADILLQISFTMFIFGMSVLVLFFYFYELPHATLDELPELDAFRFSGTVFEVRDFPRVAHIRMGTECSITGVFFKDAEEDLSVIQGKSLDVSGYKGQNGEYIFETIRYG